MSGPQKSMMRIAVTVIAGGLTLVIALQLCTAQVGGGVSRDESLRPAGDAGWLIALLYLLGTRFAYGMPALAGTAFGVAAITSLGVAAHTGIDAFRFWGAVALVLATLSLMGRREKRWGFWRQAVHGAIDEVLAPIDSAPLPRPDRSLTCPQCGAVVAISARFCRRCGLAPTVPPAA